MPAARTGSACINAATLALEDAGIPMRYIVISCSAGYLNTTPVLGQLTSSIFGANKLIRKDFQHSPLQMFELAHA
ncbi:hypothetical protein V6N13_041525 [Hibiscus sabdariffa]